MGCAVEASQTVQISRPKGHQAEHQLWIWQWREGGDRWFSLGLSPPSSVLHLFYLPLFLFILVFLLLLFLLLRPHLWSVCHGLWKQVRYG